MAKQIVYGEDARKALKNNYTTDKDNKRTLSGWETMLTAIINAGFSITGTWPLRTEMTSDNENNATHFEDSAHPIVGAALQFDGVQRQVCSHR